MRRQEDFIDAGIAYRMEHSKPMCIAGSNLADVERDFNRVISFEAGAEHGYQYAIDKACEFLEEYAANFVALPDEGQQPIGDTNAIYGTKSLLYYFRKEMEGWL